MKEFNRSVFHHICTTPDAATKGFRPISKQNTSTTTLIGDFRPKSKRDNPIPDTNKSGTKAKEKGYHRVYKGDLIVYESK